MTTICALFYGNYSDLAARCLRPFEALRGLCSFRFGANAIGEHTNQLLAAWEPHSRIYDDASTSFKYPRMRQMLHDPEITTPFVIWFDDDSTVTAPNPIEWLVAVEKELASADVIGSIYRIRLGGEQHRWVAHQPWYRGKEVQRRHRVTFATGGWWAARAAVIRDWPPSNIQHRGGDVMLGEYCRQQELRLHHFNTGVAINADGLLRESKAVRRGYDEAPVGWNWRGHGA